MKKFMTINHEGLWNLGELTNTKIDLVDSCLFDYMRGFILSKSSKIQNKTVNGTQYTLIFYSKIMADIKQLRVKSSRMLKSRIERGVNAGLFLKYLDKDDGNKLYYAITELGYEILENSMTNIDDIKALLDGSNAIENPQPPKQPDEQKEKQKTRKKDKFTLSRLTAFENLSKQYQEDLKEYIAQSGKSEIMSYEEFRDGCMMKDYKYKNFKLAYGKWAKNTKPKTTSSVQPQTSINSIEEQKIKAYYLSNGATEKQLQGLLAGLKLLENSPHKRECIYSYVEELKLGTYAFSFLRYAKECGLERESITKTVSIMGKATYSINGVQDDKEHRYNMTVAKEFEQPYMYTYAPKKGSK